MSRRNGFLQVASTSNAGTNLLSSVLSGISNKYAQKEATEQQLERDALLRADKDKKDAAIQAENTRRYEEGKTTAAAAALENTRRYEDGQTRADQALARQENDRKAQFDLLNTDTVFTIDDQDAENAKIFKTRRANEDIEIGGLKDFLSTVGTEFTDEDKKKYKTAEERDRFALGKALNAASNNLIVNSGDTIDEQDAVMRRLVNLEALKKEFTTTGLQGEDRTKRIDEIIQNQYGKRREELDARIARGEGLSKERRTEIALSRLPEDVRNNLLSPATASTILSNRVGGFAESDIRAREKARIDTLYENSKAFSGATEKAARLDILYKNSNKKTGKNASAESYNKTDKSPEEVQAALNTKIFGSLSEVSKENTSEIAGVVKTLADMGYSVYEIERAVAANTKAGLPIWGADNTNIESLEKIIASADELKNNRGNNTKPGYSKSRTPTAEDLMFVRGSERTLAQMALSDLGLDKPDRKILDVGSNWRNLALKDREQPRVETAADKSLRQQLLQEQEPQQEKDLAAALNLAATNNDNVVNEDPIGKALDAKIIEDSSNRVELLKSKREKDNIAGNPVLERAIQAEQQKLKELEKKFEQGKPLNKYALDKTKIKSEIEGLSSELEGLNENYSAGKNRADSIRREIAKLERQALLARN